MKWTHYILACLILSTLSTSIYGESLVNEICHAETGSLPENKRDAIHGPLVYIKYIKAYERAIGRCQVLPSTAFALAKQHGILKYNLHNKEDNKLFALLTIQYCQNAIKRKFLKVTKNRIKACYLTGIIFHRVPHWGIVKKYIARSNNLR